MGLTKNLGWLSKYITADSSGKIGIGTISPLSKLHVDGTVRTVLTSGTGGQTLFSAINGVSNGYLINVDTSNNITHTWHTGANNTSLRIGSGGNIQVGTDTDSGYKLDVNGTSMFRSSLQTNSLKINTATDRGKVNIETALPWGTKTNDLLNFTSYGYGGDIYTEHNSGSIKWWSADQQVVAITAWRNIPASGDVFDLAFSTNPGGNNMTERMRIDSEGNVGIGTSDPQKMLSILYPSNINKDTVQGLIRLVGQANTENSGNSFSAGVGIEFYNKWNGGGSNAEYSIGRISGRASQGYDGGLQFDVSDNSGPGQTNFSTAMSIVKNSDVLIGWSGGTYNDPVFNNVRGISLRGINNSPAVIVNNDAIAAYFGRNGTTGSLVMFNYNGATTVGSVSITSSSTSYNTSSDYRLKEDLQPMVGALERLQQLNPVNFAWKSSGERVDGFIAHELAEVIPSAVTGEKDATEEVEIIPAVLDKEGNVIEEAVFEKRDVYQGIDQSKIVPLLVAAIQELTERIKILENK